MELSPILVELILVIIQDINEQGTSILLVEQNAQMALAIADWAYVLETGRITMQGTGDELPPRPIMSAKPVSLALKSTYLISGDLFSVQVSLLLAYITGNRVNSPFIPNIQMASSTCIV